MLKLLLTLGCCAASYIGLAATAAAADLPDEALRLLENLENDISRKQENAEKNIIRKKIETIRALERASKKIENEGALKLIQIQLAKYQQEIAAAELKFGLASKQSVELDKPVVVNREAQVKDAAAVIDFDKPYFYSHPSEKHQGETGELKFYTNGKVNCYHRLGSKVMMFKKWDWSLKDGKLVIAADSDLGPIYVSKKSPQEIYLDWKGNVNKKNVAKQK